MTREKLIHRRLNPLLADLPEKFETIYPGQVKALQEVLAAFEDEDVVVLDAPTGTGKTLLGEVTRRLVKADKTLYGCHSKALQDQFVGDFPYAQVIKGRGNYPTERYPEKFPKDGVWSPDQLTCDDCTWDGEGCAWCRGKGSCPYEVAKKAGIQGALTVANTAYMLAEWNHIGKLSGRDLVVMDEADTLEAALMGFVSVEVSRKRMEKWGWNPPGKSTVKGSWEEWVNEKIPVLEDMLARERGKAVAIGGQGLRAGARAALAQRREVRYIEGLIEGLRVVKYGLENDQPWVYTGEGSSRDKSPGPKAVSFKPSRVDMFGKELLWKHGKKWLLMSATVISATEMLDSLGYSGGYRLVKVPSTFPVENRKIYPVMMAQMKYSMTDQEKAKMGAALVEVCRRHKDERILVHTASYQLAGYLTAALENTNFGQRPVITHVGSSDKAAALAKYVSKPDSILLSPSMDRGVDLPGDLCRVQVICKMPFLSLGDKQVSARLHSRGGQTWYGVQTVRTIVQMTGRAVRNPTDHASTYILDSQFQARVWSGNRGLLPDWWREAVDWKEGERIKRGIA